MTVRQNVYAEVEGQWPGESESVLAGWYDWNKATHFRADFHSTGRWEELHRTAGGRWVLVNRSQWQGEQDSARFVADDIARQWLLRQHEDEAVEEFFGEIEEERGPGRPEIGPAINVRLGVDLQVAVSNYANFHRMTRSAAIRDMLNRWLIDHTVQGLPQVKPVS